MYLHVPSDEFLLMKDKWLRLIGVPFIALVGSWFFGPETWEIGGWILLRQLAISLTVTVAIWEGCRWFHFTSLRMMPGYEQVPRRIISEVLACLVYTFLINLSLAWGLNELLHNNHDTLLGKENVLICMGFSIVPITFLLTLYESRHFLNEWKLNVQKTESLARVKLETQFEALKKQLDPHFLFNSLNTLASLIEVTNEPAQSYLERLSDVYRYVLETRGKPTVTVEEEMEFLQAYIYLVKTRFRDNLQVENELPTQVYGQHIPALSLQLLLENAIKHNVVSRDRPLKIRIFESEGCIHIENNKQLKKSLARSTKTGLQNIMHRYQLLSAQNIEILNNDALFRVSLPLLQPA